MKITTWNVNSVRTRQQHILDWLSTNPVDVLCLQETKVVDADFPRSPFESAGYHLEIFGQKAYNGVALLSREPLDSVQAGFATVLDTAHLLHEQAVAFDEQKRVITAVTPTGIRIVNLYVPNGSAVGSEKYDYKLRWFKVLQAYLAQLLGSDDLRSVGDHRAPSIVICGDFNIALEDRDIYDPEGKDTHIMASEAERAALREILDLGFADGFRKFNQEEGHFSWWDYRSGSFQRNRGWRIDHHYLTSDLYERAIACTIDPEPRKREQPSDHTPVTLELR
jgi:exodeoxyribonuclease III